MRYQRITNRGEPIRLGYRGENYATLVSFDIPDDWQDGVVQLYVLRRARQKRHREKQRMRRERQRMRQKLRRVLSMNGLLRRLIHQQDI